MNSKIVFICGNEKLEKGITNGKDIYIGDINDGFFHVTTLLNFAKENYPEMIMKYNLNNNHSPLTIACLYTIEYKHIVFLNISSTKDNEIQKRGSFLIPNEITDEQKKNLYQFADEISDYEIGIHYNLELNDGMIDDASISSTRNETPRELFDKFFDREKAKIIK